MMRLPVIVLIAVIFLIGCKGDDQPPVDFKYDYYPMEVGQERVYRMDSVIYDPVSGQIETLQSTSYRRERLVESVEMEREEIEYRIEVSHKTELEDDWQVRSFDRVSRFGTELKRTYGNQQFVLLSFPPERGASWDGLAFIDRDQEAIIAGERVKIWQDWGNFEILEDSKQASYEGTTYDDVIRVEEANFDDEVLLIRESFSEYAAGVGLVYRTQRIYDLNCNGTPQDPCRDASVPWEESAEMGYSLTQTLISQ